MFTIEGLVFKDGQVYHKVRSAIFYHAAQTLEMDKKIHGTYFRNMLSQSPRSNFAAWGYYPNFRQYYPRKLYILGLYYGSLYHYLTYGITIWGFTFNRHLKIAVSLNWDIALFLIIKYNYNHFSLLRFDLLLKYFTWMKFSKSVSNPVKLHFLNRILSQEVPHPYVCITHFETDEKLT